MSSFKTMRRNGALANLDFSVEVPADWVPVQIPDEPTDFTDITAFAPIGVFMAPYAAIVFAVAARPVYEGGTLAQWLDYVARAQQLDPGAIEEQRIGSHAGVGCWGMQTSEGAVMRSRLIMFEDGDRLVSISCMAPDSLWASQEATFLHELETFALAKPMGAKVALHDAGVRLAASTMGAAAAAASPAARRAATPDEDQEPANPATALALGADLATFEATHPVNARMEQLGTGVVPPVLDYHEQERWATLAPPTLTGRLRVPFGWHVVDDGRRILVFDPNGDTQVQLQMLARDGRPDHAILEAKATALRAGWPQLQALRLRFAGLECLGIRNIDIDGRPTEQGYILRPAPEERVLELRISASPERFPRAADLAGVLLRDLMLDGDPDPADQQQPQGEAAS